jgi:RNA polymerase sigma factor (sigma-70 family)
MEASLPRMTPAPDNRIADVVSREQSRLRRFIQRRVDDPRDAEDILQDVFHRFIEANRLLMPIEHVTGWLYRVARNRIIDLFRRTKTESLDDFATGRDDDETPGPLSLDALLPSPDEGPDAAYARRVLLDALEAAIKELPADQRDVFLAHEIEGRTFKEIAGQTGVNLNTLLSRKRYAVLRLRERLREVYEEFKKG